MTTDAPCKFTAPDKQPCSAFGDDRNRHGYCFAHHEIYLHDCAISFRRKRRKDRPAAERWALSNGPIVERMHELADELVIHERPIALEVP